MKSIELTKKHKDKLLKMCNNLFISDNSPYIDNNNNVVIWNLSKGIEAEYSVAIHWFEFCMTHLVDKLYNDEKYRDCSGYDCNLHVELTLAMLNHKMHPVDCLYEEFKKI